MVEVKIPLKKKATPKKSTEVHQSAPKSKPLTPEQIQRRNAFKLSQMERTQGFKAPLALPREDAIQALQEPLPDTKDPVMNPQNPHLSVYREFRAGKISREEMTVAIMIQTCNDKKVMDGYRFKAPPSKPVDLLRAEDRLREENEKKGRSRKQSYAVICAFYKIARTEKTDDGDFRSFFKELDQVKDINKANLDWLNEMYSELREKSPKHAAQVLSLIEEHKN